MANNPTAPLWGDISSQYLRDFLAKCPEFLVELHGSAPRSGAVNTLEAAACAGQRVEGHMAAIDIIRTMALGPKPPGQPVNIDVTRADKGGL